MKITFGRGDSAFALPKLFELLEREGFLYAIRLGQRYPGTEDRLLVDTPSGSTVEPAQGHLP